MSPVPISTRTIALLAAPFEGGNGPTGGAIELIWSGAGALEYLGEGNKLERVLGGLQALQSGKPVSAGRPPLAPDETKLRMVIAELAPRLMAEGRVDTQALDEALREDGFAVFDGDVSATPPADQPVDRLAQYVEDLFGKRPELEIAANHYEQASRAFERNDWEAANAQFRSSFDAAYDALAKAKGAPTSRVGGKARAWLENEELIDKDLAALLQAFGGFAGPAGSHAGISEGADAQLRRHVATALIAYAIARLD